MLDRGLEARHRSGRCAQHAAEPRDAICYRHATIPGRQGPLPVPAKQPASRCALPSGPAARRMPPSSRQWRRDPNRYGCEPQQLREHIAQRNPKSIRACVSARAPAGFVETATASSADDTAFHCRAGAAVADLSLVEMAMQIGKAGPDHRPRHIDTAAPRTSTAPCMPGRVTATIFPDTHVDISARRSRPPYRSASSARKGLGTEQLRNTKAPP